MNTESTSKSTPTKNFWQDIQSIASTIFIPSGPGYQPMDGYALYWIARSFQIKDDVKIVPVYGNVEASPRDNLIIIGRAWVYGSKTLIKNLIGEHIKHRGQFRFLDNQQILDVKSGIIYHRMDKITHKLDFGLTRISKEPNRIIVHSAGLGSIGTLGACIGIANTSSQIAMDIKPSIQDFLQSDEKFMEILVRSEWNDPKNIGVVAPNDVQTRLEMIRINPFIDNTPTMDLDSHSSKITAFTKERSEKKIITKSKNEFAILQAIAKRTSEFPMTYEDEKAYISYKDIQKDENVKKLKLDSNYVRVTLGRIRNRLEKPEWMSIFPNLLLESSSNSNRAKKGFRFRVGDIKFG